jgi:hypothetical protein
MHRQCSRPHWRDARVRRQLVFSPQSFQGIEEMQRRPEFHHLLRTIHVPHDASKRGRDVLREVRQKRLSRRAEQ